MVAGLWFHFWFLVPIWINSSFSIAIRPSCKLYVRKAAVNKREAARCTNLQCYVYTSRSGPATKNCDTFLMIAANNSLLTMYNSTGSCTVVDEGVFGPQVTRSCLQGFDFTLLFEESILTITPVCIALIWLPFRIHSLWKSDSKVQRSWLYVLKVVSVCLMTFDFFLSNCIRY